MKRVASAVRDPSGIILVGAIDYLVRREAHELRGAVYRRVINPVREMVYAAIEEQLRDD